MNITKALVVDDSKVAHLTLRKLLMERNIEVDWVGSGEDAIAYMQDHHPNIIFMDVMMPGIDGFETTAAIIANAANSAPPIIMCSASATEEDMANARASGAFEFLSKPYTPASLDQVLGVVRKLPEPVTEAPATEAPPSVIPEPMAVPAISQAAITATEVEQIAVRAANAVAERVAAEVANSRVEQLSRTLIEQNTSKLIQELAPKATQTAVQAAQEAAKNSIAIAIDAARDSLRLNIDKAAKAAAEQTIRESGEEMIKRQLRRGLMVIRDEMNKHMEQRLQTVVREMLTANMAAPEFKQQLGQLVKENALPLVQSLAQQPGSELAQEATAITASIGKQAKLALGLAILALVLALGAVVVSFLY